MGPVLLPIGRAKAIQLVQEGALPVQLGSPRPTAMIVQQDGKFRIREIVIDANDTAAAASASNRARSASWMPEHYYAMGKPTGKIIVEAATKAELVALIGTMTWPEDW